MMNQFMKRGALVLSMIICFLMALATVNIAFVKDPLVEEVLWIYFAIWGGLFFLFLFVKVFSAQKNFRKNIPGANSCSSDVGGILKIHD